MKRRREKRPLRNEQGVRWIINIKTLDTEMKR